MRITTHVFWKEKVADDISKASDFSNFEIFQNEKDAWDHLVTLFREVEKKDPEPRISLNISWSEGDASLSASEWFNNVTEAGHWLFALADDIATKEANPKVD